MYRCESWTIKKAERRRIDAFELWCWRRLLRDPWTVWDIQPVHPKRNQSWIFTGRTDAEAETPILWPPDVKSWLIWKDPDAEKDWRQEKGTTEDEMVGWYHLLNGHGFGWTPEDCDGQKGLACCDSWGHKESDTTEWLKSELYLPGSYSHGIFQARLLEWVPISFSRGSFQPRDWTLHLLLCRQRGDISLFGISWLFHVQF